VTGSQQGSFQWQIQIALRVSRAVEEISRIKAASKGVRIRAIAIVTVTAARPKGMKIFVTSQVKATAAVSKETRAKAVRAADRIGR